MKQQIFLLSAIVLLGCTDSPKQTEASQPADSLAVDTVQLAPAEPAHKHVKGTVGDGTSMNVIEIVDAENGDTLYVTTPAQMIVGGVRAGEELDIVYTEGEEDYIGLVSVNLTALTKVWNRQNEFGVKQSMELRPDGTVNTWNMGSAAYDSWKLEGGKLLLQSSAALAKEAGEHTDTLQILSLKKDELVLSLHDQEVIYTR
jgi:hypothetical protein